MNNTATNSIDWPEIIPLETTDTKSFPVQALPKVIGDYVQALSEFTQTPSEMAGLLSLGVLAAAFQHRYEVKVQEGYTEPLCLYTVAVANPGERKSPVHKHLLSPVYEYEKNRRKSEYGDVLANEAQYRALEKRLAVQQKKFAEGKATKEDIESASKEIAEFVKIHPYRLAMDDVTPEKLIDAMSTQKSHALIISSAEGGIFDIMSGRYSDIQNIDVFLKAWSRESISVERVGRAANHINKPALSFILTVQPEVLSGLMSNPSMRGCGLCGRFLYAVCNSKIGTREIMPSPIPKDITAHYHSFITKILSDEQKGIISLGEDAYKVYVPFARFIESCMNDYLDFMPDWANKFTGSVVRIAGLIHASENNNPCAMFINADTMKRAQSIGMCLLNHAQQVYGEMSENNDLREVKYLLKRIRAYECCEITKDKPLTKRELFQMCRGHYKKNPTWKRR